MNLAEAIAIIEQYKNWRRDMDNKIEAVNPVKLTLALEVVIKKYKDDNRKLHG